MLKEQLKNIANETVEYTKQGYYYINNTRVDIKNQQVASEKNSNIIGANEIETIINKLQDKKVSNVPFYEIIDESTVKAIFRLSKAGYRNIGVLNFASAKNPGGGFLNGSLAQEESLAMSSGLYHIQLKNKEYYDANRSYRSAIYTDNMIYSPGVVFIRDENLKLVSEPITASVLTVPAVNKGAVIKNEKHNIKKADIVMKNRIRNLLGVFAEKGNKTIILGAFGCGVFKNNPYTVAQMFNEVLKEEGFEKYFEHITFSIYDKSRTKDVSTAFLRNIK
jgi:uncharacterized protein (TIGR02452 family)